MNRETAFMFACKSQLHYILQSIEIQASKGYTSFWYDGLLFTEVIEQLKSPLFGYGVMPYDRRTQIIWSE